MIFENNRIYRTNESGRMIAEVTFPNRSPNTVEIDHTFVDPVLRGQGVAGQLLEAAAKNLRERGLKAVPTCAYAVEWFQKHPEYEDVLSGTI